MTLEELYKQKGELVTQIEVNQARLQNVNQQIITILNNQEKQNARNDERPNSNPA